MKKLFLLLALFAATQSTQLEAMNLFRQAAKIITFNWLFNQKDVQQKNIQELHKSGLQLTGEVVIANNKEETKRQNKKTFIDDEESDDDWEILGELEKPRNPLLTSTIHEEMKKEDHSKYVQKMKEMPENPDGQENEKSILSQNKMLITFHEENKISPSESSFNQTEEPLFLTFCQEDFESKDIDESDDSTCIETETEIEEFCTSDMQPEEKDKYVFQVRIGNDCPVRPAIAQRVINEIIVYHQWAAATNQNLVYTPRNLSELICYQSPEKDKKMFELPTKEKKQEMEPEQPEEYPDQYTAELAAFVQAEETLNKTILQNEIASKNAEFHIHDRNHLYQAPNAGLTPQEYLAGCAMACELTKEERKIVEEKKETKALKGYGKGQAYYHRNGKNRFVHYFSKRTYPKPTTRKKRFVRVDLTSL